MFGGKLQLRVRSRQWTVKVGSQELIQKEGTTARYLVGRSAKAFLSTDAPGVAESHCWITWDGIQVKVTPCGSAIVKVNGMVIDGESLVLPGDQIQLGELVLRLVRDESPPSAFSEMATNLVYSPDGVASATAVGTHGAVHAKGEGADGTPGRAERVAAPGGPARSTSPRPLPRPAQPPKAPNTVHAADEALTKLFQRRLAEQKRVVPRPRPDSPSR